MLYHNIFVWWNSIYKLAASTLRRILLGILRFAVLTYKKETKYETLL